ncbi:MAG: hypothetical protein Q8Q09_10080 [Deltaproteobacteria bacterium]|nr:hypothetical protein [Deltaproteobacteria bacterium]
MNARRWLVRLTVGTLLTVGSLGFAASRGWLSIPGLAAHAQLEAQLRDRGTMALAGRLPFGVSLGETRVDSYEVYPQLLAALHGRDRAAVANAVRATHVDGLLVQSNRALGTEGSALRAMSELRAMPGLTATWMEQDVALYEVKEQPEISADDASRLIECVRLMIEGAAAPPERVFPEPLRGARPAEVMVVIRDGGSPILWRAVRGGSVARALVDATYAVIDRWNTRQQQTYGSLRDAIRRMPLTVSIFYDKGVLETRQAPWIDHAVNSQVFAIGYERQGRWEYVLPTAPGIPARRSSEALSQLVREHDVPPPGYGRTDLTLFRFRALQIIESTAGGAITIVNPS